MPIKPPTNRSTARRIVWVAASIAVLSAVPAVTRRTAHDRAPSSTSRDATGARDERNARAPQRRASPRSYARPAATSGVLTSAVELADRLDEVSHGVGPDAVHAYGAFMDGLRADPARATDLLLEAFERMDAGERRGAAARPVIFTLGVVGDPRALGPLAATLDEPLPPSRPLDHDTDLRSEALVTRSMTLEAMASIVEREGSPATDAALRRRLERLVGDRGASDHEVAAAIEILRAHAVDPSAEVARVEAALGRERAWMAHLDFRTDLPAATP